MKEKSNLINSNKSSRKNLLKIGAGVIFVLVMANLWLLKNNLSKIQEENVQSQVMGISFSTCPSGCLNVIPKKIYIPLGSGTANTLNVWENTGAQTYINLADYPGYKSINWEASFKIPKASGKVYARLINVNDNVEIWGSEVVSEGNTFQFVSSPPITLWQGNKLYRVQLKSTMGVEANLVGARIVVTLR